MYLKHFGLNELPFGITPDTGFICSVHYHQEALNTLLLALENGEGFVKITGEVGTGKTLLCRRLLQTLDDSWVSAYLPNPSMDARTLFLALAEELDVKSASALDAYHLVRQINLSLLNLARAKKRVVVCIDEAQAMPQETLEALRLDEVGLYVAHRLRVAGYRGEGLFSGRALRALHRASGGTPRLINILAHKSLLSVFGEGRQMANVRHVCLARKDTEGARRIGWLWG